MRDAISRYFHTNGSRGNFNWFRSGAISPLALRVSGGFRQPTFLCHSLCLVGCNYLRNRSRVKACASGFLETGGDARRGHKSRGAGGMRNLQPQAYYNHTMPKLTPKIILEGTRLTFKTDIAFALNEHPRMVGPRKYRYHSPLVSGEWCAFTNFPWGRGLINFEPQEEALAMETYATWVKLFELQRYYSWIVDRFHLSTRMYQWMKYNKDYDFRWLEERLLPLNFRLVMMTRSPESFEAARAERLKVSGNPSQYDDLNLFVEEQALIRRLFDESILPKIEIDISDNDIHAAVERIADWMESTGGLYMNS